MKKLLLLLYFIPIITFGQTTQNITPFFGADFPYHNPTDSIYINWANKLDGISTLYTGWYLRNNFLQKNDSAHYITPYGLQHDTWTFTNGITGNLTTLTNGSGIIGIFGNEIYGSNSFQLDADSGSLTLYSNTLDGGTNIKWANASGFFQFLPYQISTGGLTGSGSHEQFLIFPQRVLTNDLYYYLPAITSNDTIAVRSDIPSAGSFIQNQSVGPQFANAWINGRMQFTNGSAFTTIQGNAIYLGTTSNYNAASLSYDSTNNWVDISTSNNIINFPNNSGTVALTSNVLNLSGSNQSVTQIPTFNNGLNIPTGNTSIFLRKNSSNFLYEYSDGVSQGESLFAGAGAGNTTNIGNSATPFEQNNIGIGDSTLTKMVDVYATTAIGWDAGHNYTHAYSNTIVGYRADELDSIGYGNALLGTYIAGHNINSHQMSGVGWHWGLYHSTGSNWAGVGDSFFSNNVDGVYNTGIGSNVGTGSLHGSYNILIGPNQGGPGNDPGSYRLMIDVSNLTNPLIDGHFDTRLLTFNGSVTVAGALQNSASITSISGLARAFINSPTLTPTANNDILTAADFLGSTNTGTGALTANWSGTTTASDGTYTAQTTTTTSGTGSGATYTITVASGSVTAATPVVNGTGYTTSSQFVIATIPGVIFTVASLGYTNVIKYSARFNTNPIQIPAISTDPTLTGNASMWYNYTTGNFNIKANGTVYALNALPTSVLASGTLGVARGGTGLGSYTAAGSLLYSASTSTTGQLADVTTGSILTSGGVGAVPAYSTTLPNGISATTQTAGDNSTKVATTAYVETAVAPAASNDLSAQTNTGTVTSTTSAAATSTYLVDGYLNVTAISTDVIQVQCTYTDENSTAQTLNFSDISATGNNSFHATIRVKASTPITLKTNLSTSGGTVTFDAGGYIKKAY